jgi:hypothetical protein
MYTTFTKRTGFPPGVKNLSITGLDKREHSGDDKAHDNYRWMMQQSAMPFLNEWHISVTVTISP